MDEGHSTQEPYLEDVACSKWRRWVWAAFGLFLIWDVLGDVEVAVWWFFPRWIGGCIALCGLTKWIVFKTVFRL